MPNTREKLIELCGDLMEIPCCDTYEGMADYLIANNVVPVVRCKDCKHYADSPYDNGDMMCDRWGEWIFPNDDDFCSYGERRTE